jgi:hypothetical protein
MARAMVHPVVKQARSRGHPVTLRFIDWIWHIRGSLTLPPACASDDAFDRLEPLFQQTGTSHDRTANRLIFRKKDQPAQDKMAVFDHGVLQIDRREGGPVLHYHLTSRALLFCFLMPLLFLGFAQLNLAVGAYEKAHAQAAGKADKAAAKTAKKQEVAPPQNPIDKALGAPAPDKPKDKGAEGEDNKFSPRPGYIFAAIFAVLYLIGRVREDRKVRALFEQTLLAGQTDLRRPSARQPIDLATSSNPAT